MRTISLLAALLTAAALGGCGGEGDSGSGTGGGDAGRGPGLSIEEAIASELDELLLVNGNLLAIGDEVRLCSALAESFPPQCSGPSLLVEGLDLDGVEGLVTEGNVSWIDRPIQLLGRVEDETITVSENATT
jgi:hypothetical protein